MRGWLIGALVVVAAVFAGACGKDGETPAGTAPAGTAPAGPELTNAKAVADAMSGAGLGCDDREPEAPEPSPGFPLPSEILKCTVSGQEAAITVYAKDGDTERSRAASSKILCKEAGKAETEKRSAVYGKYFFVGTSTGDPAMAARIAQATGGEVKAFTCS